MKKALILAGDGINCEIETMHATRDAGFSPQTLHVNDFLKAKGAQLADTKLLVVPGGFSFGDELGSGKILALKLKHGVGEALTTYIDGGGAVLGICNGFQVLTQLGVFGAGVVLTHNKQGQFLNRWVGLEITGKSIFTDGLKKSGVTRLELPMRHGEGRLICPENLQSAMLSQGSIVLKYEEDVNGAWNRAAALSSHNGRVMGLMPHPEAFWTEELHPWGNGRHVPLGVELFRSAYHELVECGGKS
ncbi:MAG: phosphoribosylformylglycinamidine synthase subunit PurQ [Deltaproteobacteria bacterium]|nr:phosphoribosylformylglycinamidine synthase subunit PurQ [Deltaproteobacteria bacterium]